MSAEDEEDGCWTWGPLLLPKRPESSAPSYLTPALASDLWCLLPARGLLGRRSWQRRYVLAAANFVYIFASADDVDVNSSTSPTQKLPLHALCTEDLGFAAQELTDTDVAQCAELARLSEWAFTLVPAEEEPGRGHSASSFRFCAETAPLRSHWAATLKRSKCAALGVELQSARAELELREQELCELKRVLAQTMRRSWADPSQAEREATVRVQAALRGRIARTESGKLKAVAVKERGTSRNAMTKAIDGFSSGAVGLLGSAGAALEGAAVGVVGLSCSGADKVTGGLKGAASGLTLVTHGPLRSVDGGFKMVGSGLSTVARGLKKGAESVKGGVVYAFEGGNDESSGDGSSGDGARESMAALHERSEKLESLKSKVDGLAVESETFATNAHRLNQARRW